MNPFCKHLCVCIYKTIMEDKIGAISLTWCKRVLGMINFRFYLPQLIDDTNQNKEGVLADSLLEGVRTVAECSICAFVVKDDKNTNCSTKGAATCSNICSYYF